MGKERRYTPEEVTAIVSSALRRHRDSNDIGHDELLETAAELGIPRQDVEAAAKHLATERDMERAKEKWVARKRHAFRQHLVSFVIVNVFLLLVAWMTGSHAWFVWVLLGWGMGLAFHTYAMFFPDPEEVDKGARQILAEKYNTSEWRAE